MAFAGQPGKGRGIAAYFGTLASQSKLDSSLLGEIALEFADCGGPTPQEFGRLYESRLARDKSQQRASGSFYTPDYLVDFVVHQTLAPVVEGRSLAALYKLRILDPSCGGGAFLLGVLRFLEARCLALGARSGQALRRRLCQCLVGIDLDADALAVTRVALHLAVGGARPIKSLKLHLGDALLPETQVGAIDAIVGNPPWGQKGLRLDPASRARYRELFVTASGVWDPFKLFVERCHQLLPPGARWGLVLPDIVLLKNLQCVRDVILAGSELADIAHCGQAFAGANIDAVAMVATRATSPKIDHELQVWPQLRADWQTTVPARYSQRQSVYRELPGHRFNLYLHGPALDLYRRLQEQPRLGALCAMHEGVHSGNVRAKLFVDSKRNHGCRKLIFGRKELAPYQLTWAGAWIDTRASCIDKAVGEYANLGRRDWHQAKKIVVRRTGDRVIAAYDQVGFYVSNNMFVLLPGDACDEEECKALVSLLNSRFMTWYYRAVQPRVGRLFAELKLVHLREFPLPTRGRLASHIPKLARLCDEASQKGAKSVAERVDAIVESAFEISHAERELIKLAQ